MKLGLLLAILVGGVMTMSVFAGSGAGQIYQVGPETLTAESSLIVTGQVINHSRTVTSTSAGAEPIPLVWTVSGQVDQPRTIKGEPPTVPAAFSRQERSPIVPADPAVPLWQMDLGELAADEAVVVFFQEPQQKLPIALPAGNDSTFVSLVEDIVRIQQAAPADQPQAWLDYLRSARTDQARKAALRSLVRLKVQWVTLAPVLETLVNAPGASDEIRGFVFGIVTFAVTHEIFNAPRTDPVQFLGREFVRTQAPDVSLQYILNLKLLLSYTSQADGSPGRLAVQQQIIAALNERASVGAMPPELEEQYRQIQATHPAVR